MGTLQAGDAGALGPCLRSGGRLQQPQCQVWRAGVGAQPTMAAACMRAARPLLQTALLTNTLVCLPTGLGKTLIAAVLMHNFARWFPEVRCGQLGGTTCKASSLCALLSRTARNVCASCLVRAVGS